jgi:hypothetical protein
VYTGNGPAVTNLVLVATTIGPDAPSQLVFSAVAGATYAISAEAILPYQSDFNFSLLLDTPQPAQLTAADPFANGGFRLLLTTLAEQDWVLEGSTNMVEWNPLATNSSRHHVIEFVDLTASNTPAKFYRVVAAGRQTR